MRQDVLLATGATVAELTGTAAAIDIRCNGTADGSVDITVSGGLAPSKPSCGATGATTEDISGLTAGNYTVTISDGGGCSVDVTATIAEPAILGAVLTAGNIVCAGTPTGSVDLTVSGGTTPYYFPLE